MSKEIKKIISAANSGERFPVMDLVRESPGLAAQISKLVSAELKPTYDSAGNLQPIAPDIGVFKQASENVGQNITDAQTTMQILPDMELAAQILVSSIISPKDMMTTELTYASVDGLMSPDVTAAMMSRIRTHLEQDYKITPLLPVILRDMLFETGSYAVAVIPENSIDDAINGSNRISMESLSKEVNSDGTMRPKGLLGPVNKSAPTVERLVPGLSLESFEPYRDTQSINPAMALEASFGKEVETFISVTDNLNLLKIPRINQRIREQRVMDALSGGNRAMESFSPTKLTDREMSSLMYKDRKFAYKPISALKTQEQLNRNTVGNSLVFHFPSESVIPVYTPGAIDHQVGYFVILDADGNPVTKPKNNDYYAEMGSRLNSSGSFPSAMLGKVQGQMNGFNPSDRDRLDYSARAFGPMVEQDLMARLRNGVYGNGVALARNDDIYRIMLARALSKQHTQLLFVPTELMTYFAFRYNDNGFGKSMLDDMKIINSLRTLLLFANVMASLKNSIGRTSVKIKLDEHDPNPQKTLEIAKDLILRSRQATLPVGMSNPADVSDFLAKANVEFIHEGHPGLPDVNVDFGESASSYVKPDTDLEDSLRKRSIMSTGLSPETVDATFNTEFATSIVTNNILLSKRVMQMQEQFTPQLSDHLRKELMNSESVMKDLYEILFSNFDKIKLHQDDVENPNGEEGAKGPKGATKDAVKVMIIHRVLNEFVMNFEVTLPKPNSVTLENQLAALETYAKGLDACLDSHISEDMFTQDTVGEVASQVGTAKAVIKAYYMRKFMSENGILPELAELTALDEEGMPKLDVLGMQSDHIAALNKSLTQFMVGLQPIKKASDTVMQNMVGDTEQAPESSSEETSDTPDDDGNPDDGGNLDSDMPPLADDDLDMNAPVEGEGAPAATDEPKPDAADTPAEPE